MMKVLAIALLLACTTSVAAETAWEIKPFAAECHEAESGNTDDGQDYLFKRCAGIGKTSTWILYQEGTRMSVGFGSNPHVAAEGLETGRDANWPVQWGGMIRKAVFVPAVAIARFIRLGESKDTLLVFRLLPNGSSCLVGDVPAGPSQSAKAKAIAEKAMTKWKCLSEPVPVTS